MKRLLVLAPLLLFIAACDDNAGATPEAFVAPARDMGTASDAGTPNIVGYPYKLEIEGESELSLYYNQEIELRVRYVDDGDQDGAAGDLPIFDGTVELSFEPEDQSFASIRSRTRRTGSNGLAVFSLTTNSFTGRIRVVARAANARPVAWTIRVSKDPLGAVNVRVQYDPASGRYLSSEFDEIRVKLIEGTCTTALTANNRRYSFTGPSIMGFDGDDISPFAAVPGAVEFAAIAWGRNVSGRNIGRGCTDGVTSAAAMPTEAIVILEDEPLEFKGVFNVDHQFDITEMLRGTDDEGLNGFVDALEVLGAIGGGNGMGMYPRGDAIIGLLCDRASINAAVCAALRLFGARVLEEEINDNVDPETLAALDVFGDLYTNLSVFNVYGEMEFLANYPTVEGYLRDNESRWQGIRFVWREGCAAMNAGDCVREFPFVDGSQGRESPITARFDALYEASEDTLFISRHQMSLSYGRLVVLALERWILPQAVPEADVGPNGMPDGVVSFAELLGVLVDCSSVANGDPTIEGLCTAGLSLGGDFLRNELLNIDDTTDLITLEGSVKVADMVVDLRADYLYDGIWNGTFGENGDLTSSIGSFEGCRDEDCEAIEMMLMP